MKCVDCLVTGGTGFLGRHVVRRLTEAGNRVTLLARRPIPGCRSLCGDLTEPVFDLGGHCFSVVYHLAGLAHLYPRTEAARELFFKVNAQGTSNLLCALERTARLPQALVLVSTVAVYGVEQGTLLDEATPRQAADPYGASKKEAEDLVLDWSTRHGVRAAVVRLPLVAGKGAPGNLGTMVRALTRGRYLGVGGGDSRRSMVLAADVAAILPEIARMGGLFHLTDGCHPSFAELESALAAALRIKAPRRLPLGVARMGACIGDGLQRLTGLKMPLTTSTLKKMTSTLTFSDRRARQNLGWRPSRVLDHAAELVE